jgi:hypothetical protein
MAKTLTISNEADANQAWENLKLEVMTELGYNDSDLDIDSIEDEVNRDTDTKFIELYGISYYEEFI